MLLKTRTSTGINNKLMAAAVIVACGFSAAYSAESSAADAYLRKTSASVNLSNNSATPTAITQVTVPPGTWLVTAKANPVNFGAADYVRCRLMVGTSQKDAAATLLGNAAPGPTGETGPSVAEIVLQTAITTTGSKVFKLDCQHDFPSPGMYVDPGASIMVVRSPGPLG